MKSCVMALFCAFDRGAIPARARWSVCEARVGVGSSSDRPGEGYGSESSIAGSGVRGNSGGMAVPRCDRRSLGKVAGDGFEVGVDCRPRRTLGEGSASEKRVRGSAKGKTTWDVVSRAVGKGVQAGCAVETKGSGLEEVAMGSHVEAGGHEDEAPLWAEGRQQG